MTARKGVQIVMKERHKWDTLESLGNTISVFSIYRGFGHVRLGGDRAIYSSQGWEEVIALAMVGPHSANTQPSSHHNRVQEVSCLMGLLERLKAEPSKILQIHEFNTCRDARGSCYGLYSSLGNLEKQHHFNSSTNIFIFV